MEAHSPQASDNEDEWVLMGGSAQVDSEQIKLHLSSLGMATPHLYIALQNADWELGRGV